MFKVVLKIVGISTRWLDKFKEWLDGLKEKLEVEAAEWIQEYMSNEDDFTEEFLGRTNLCRGRCTRRLAREAYLHFGPRKLNTANLLVTRKWMVKWIEEQNTSIRVVDKITIIDGALFMSFIPSDAYLHGEEMSSTDAYLDLVPTGADPK